MSERIDVQYFAESGTWVRPPGAVRVDYLIRVGGGGSADVSGGVAGGNTTFHGDSVTVTAHGGGSVGIGGMGRDGQDGAVQTGSFDPDEMPERVEVAVGRGGWGAEFEHVKAGDGAGGYALFLTHLQAS